MTLREFIDNLNEFVKENPDLLGLEVITARDDEGNGYSRVYFTPTKGNYKDDDYTEFSQFEDFDLNENDINTVCLN